MGSLKGVGITKGSIGANVIAPDTSASALLATGVAVAGKLALDTVYVISSLKQAVALGITPSYDTTNKVVLYQHIEDFYSNPLNVNVKLYLMVTDMVGAIPGVLIEDVNGLYTRKLLIAGGGTIKQLGFAFNVPDGYPDTIVDGINTDVKAAISKAQALYTWAYSTDRPCQILLEGRAISDTVSALLDLGNITVGAAVLDANKVSVVIGQDWDYAESRTGMCKKYAGVGKALGTVAAARVNQSIGDTLAFNISDAVNKKWVTAGLSNHKKVDDLEAYISDINAKGYIFAGTYTGISGLRWNGDRTCTAKIIDVDGNINEHTIYYGRTMDLAVMRLKAVLSPYMRRTAMVDARTGKLPTAVAKNLEGQCDQVFTNMVNEKLASGGKTNVSTSDDLFTGPLNISFRLVPTIILEDIEGVIYLNRTI